MNELECIIDEVLKHLIQGEDLSDDISLTDNYNFDICIKYFNFSVILKEHCFVLKYTQYKTRTEFYVLDKEVQFERLLCNNEPLLCTHETVQKMVDIRKWYGFETHISNEYLEDFNTSE